MRKSAHHCDYSLTNKALAQDMRPISYQLFSSEGPFDSSLHDWLPNFENKYTAHHQSVNFCEMLPQPFDKFRFRIAQIVHKFLLVGAMNPEIRQPCMDAALSQQACSNNHTIRRQLVLQMGEDGDFPTGRSRKTVKQVEHGNGIEGPDVVGERLEDVMLQESTVDIRPAKSFLGHLQTVPIHVDQGELAIDGKLAVLGEVARPDSDVEMSVAHMLLEKGQRDRRCRAAVDEFGKKEQDEVVIEIQMEVVVFFCLDFLAAGI